MSGLHRRQDVWITVENRVKISSSTSLRADRKADTSIPNAAALAMLLFSRVNMSNSSRLPISLGSTLSLHFDCTSDPFRNTQEFNDLGLVCVHKRIMAVVVAGDAVPSGWCGLNGAVLWGVQRPHLSGLPPWWCLQWRRRRRRPRLLHRAHRGLPG